jgi:hypothetical protein
MGQRPRPLHQALPWRAFQTLAYVRGTPHFQPRDGAAVSPRLRRLDSSPGTLGSFSHAPRHIHQLAPATHPEKPGSVLKSSAKREGHGKQFGVMNNQTGYRNPKMPRLSEHFCRALDNRLWNRQSQRFGRLHVDNEFELGGLLEREIVQVRPLENPIHL